MWAEKYRPRSLDEMIGNEEARIVLVGWLKNWKPGKRAALLVGPPGVGKTTLVHLAAKEEGMNLVELNASDSRTKEKLGKKIGEAIASGSLFLDERILIFLDEVDGLAGSSDYGALEFIKDAVKETKNPIAMAANNPDSDQVKKLAEVSVVIRLKPPPPREVELYLREVMRKEDLRVSDEVLRNYVTGSKGDMRHAINSLQSHRDKPSSGYKDTTFTEADSLNAFFEARDSISALAALRRSPLPPKERIREIFRSLAMSNLSPEKMSRSLEVMSRADILLGRILKTQEWRMLRYLDAMLAHELLGVISGERVGYRQDNLPWAVLLRIWNDSKKIKELSKRYASRAHESAREAAVADLPFVFLMSAVKKYRDEVVRSLDLDATYEKFLLKEAKRGAG